MSDTLSTQLDRVDTVATAAPNPFDPLRGEYTGWQALFEVQPGLVQRYLDAQGRLVRQHHVGSRQRDLLRLANGQADV